MQHDHIPQLQGKVGWMEGHSYQRKMMKLHEDFNDFQVTSIHQPNVGAFQSNTFHPLNEQPCNTFSTPEHIFSACEDTFLNKM